MKELEKEDHIKTEKEDHIKISAKRAKAHFMKVCKHGVPHGFMCKSCDKIISIPEDAKIKPKKEKKDGQEES